MIPLQLSLEGIYSYQKRQTIDFENLTEGGLFGIFGAVASGKSTILEAISFALYGESDRMNKSNRAYNMMNLKSDRMFIEFDFLNFENKKYRVVREYRRNSKNFNNVLHDGTTFYEWDNDAWTPLEHSNAESIIGLSAQNFKRTIIIPQGKFKEFIELGGTDRTSMMKEIFNLHHFDLYGNVRALYSANEHQLDVLLGKLSGYDDVSKEAIDEKTKIYAEQKAAFEQQLAKHKELSDAFEQLKQLNVDFNNLQQQKKKLTAEEARKEDIEKQDNSLKQYVVAQQQFEAALNLRYQLDHKINAEEKTLSNKKGELVASQEKLEEIDKQLYELKPFIDNIDTHKNEVIDLELIGQILTYRENIKRGEKRTRKGREVVDELVKKATEHTKTISETDSEIDDIKNKLIDANILAEIQVWFITYNSLLKQIADKKERCTSIAEKIDKVENEFQALGYFQESWKELIEKEREALNKQLSAANSQKTQLEVKQKIAEFADEIHEGDPCPLCGSLEHPHVIETEDVSVNISNNQKEINRIEDQIKLLSDRNSKLIQLQESKSNLDKLHQESKEELSKLENEKENHLSLFAWKQFSATDEKAFKTKKATNDTLITKKEALEKELKSERAKLEGANKELEKDKKLLAEIEDENRNNEIHIASKSSQIKHLQLADFENETIETINDKVSDRKQLIKSKELNYKALEKQKNEVLLAISAQKATIEAIDKQLDQLKAEAKQNNTTIANKLSESSFDTIDEVEQLLSEKRDVERERTLIENFRINYARLKHSIEELEKKLEGKAFSIEYFEQKRVAFEESESAINTLRANLATLKHDLERIEKEYKEKKSLLIEKEKLETRKANIGTLTQLFKASGFVNYVSSIYLKNLCAIANERFHRLTKNQLSLQINDKNDFEIVDYLNNGRTRSVRTLSGGQNFQVSLSLALALAENVQSLTNSKKNFFFIDEGFGTQDSESVNIVFETLTNLQKENRIVGIISHVEELQERIPKSLFIRKDLEEGSLIETVE